ncbi:hypothetical protein F511_25296 [Dorcoceras hygrometricum]|uniref:Uncharacterized protein n=1 Tax=Dorcoceras hygrometricum TaxID=472368 RepID=A0A2Z7DCG6_9LAMI|nr:hypothetical protein F511_25296 [Dorcoceras hygrometricum]
MRRRLLLSGGIQISVVLVFRFEYRVMCPDVIVDSMRRRLDKLGSVEDEVDELEARMDDMELVMARFHRMNPQTFNADEPSSDAESWLQHIKGLFDRVSSRRSLVLVLLVRAVLAAAVVPKLSFVASVEDVGDPDPPPARQQKNRKQMPGDDQYEKLITNYDIHRMFRNETPSSACTRRTDEISTNGFSSSNWPETIFRRRRAAAAACREEGGRWPKLEPQCKMTVLPLNSGTSPPPRLHHNSDRRSDRIDRFSFQN